MSDRLITALEAAIAETERIARDASPSPWYGTNPGPPDYHDEIIYDAEHDVVADRAGWGGILEQDMRHIVHNEPARVLRRLARDRKLLELHTPRSHAKRAFVEEAHRKDPAVAHEPTGALTWTACPTCGGRDWDIERFDVLEPCDTLRLLAEDYEIEVES